MEINSFYQLAVEDYNLFHLFGMYQKWDNMKVIHMQNRKSAGLLYLQACTAAYDLGDGHTLTAPRGSVLFLPQGSSYRCTFYADDGEKARCMLVEFVPRTGDGGRICPGDRVCMVGDEQDPLVPELFAEAVEAYSRPVYSPPVFKAAVYQLIARLAGRSRQQSIHSRHLSGIQPALDHMEKDPLHGIGVAQLAQLCHMSEVSFRKKFRQYTGMAPAAYILKQRLRHAKRLLRSGLYSVAEAAQLAGFEDPSYFSKVFKKHTGLLPGEYMRRY